MSKYSTGPDKTQRLLAICGIIGPVSYAIVLITLGSLELGYSHVTQTMSTLGAAGAPLPPHNEYRRIRPAGPNDGRPSLRPRPRHNRW